MSALDLVRVLSQAVFALIFALAVFRAIRRPSRASIDFALLFACPGLLIVETAAFGLLGQQMPQPLAIASIVILLALPLATLRAIEELTSVARGVVPAAFAGWIVASALLVSFTAPLSPPVTLLILGYFVFFEAYAGYAVFRGASGSRGVTRRRLQFVAAGTLLLALVFVVAGLAIVWPPAAVLSQPIGLLAALAYLIGFAPPAFVRRAWQAPALHEFIRSTNRLAAETTEDEVRWSLATAIAQVMGHPVGSLAIWDEERKVLGNWTNRREKIDRTLDESFASRAFLEQRAVAETNTGLAAPLTAGTERLGAVATITARSTSWLDDDLSLLALIGEHAAIVVKHDQLYHQVRAQGRDLERSIAELKVLNGEIESFSYAVSHDLRAPLRSIDGFSQILVEDKAEALGEDGRQLLGRVRAAAGRMAELIDDMLALSLATRQKMVASDVELDRIARGVIDELRAHEPGRAVEVQIDAPAKATGDARLLRIVVTNLLANSWKFTRDRRPAHISFGAAEHSNGEATFFVRDDGVGFDPRYAGKLFGAFQRLHAVDQFEGTGIGLATVHRIIRRHGGRVWAEGEVGKGATFYFTLPTHAEKVGS